jgi:sterol desaturase/sphingolipid hydroxylase (fatty acid hydroxylase superfamily)
LILGFFEHWDLFPHKFHLIHHYKFKYNFGSHISIFDIFFDTYYNENSNKNIN